MTEHCPTAGICPPCREGWGHWTGFRFEPTEESVLAASDPWAFVKRMQPCGTFHTDKGYSIGCEHDPHRDERTAS